MGLLVGIGWIIVGVIYVLYKLGSEEFDGGVTGGILTAVLPIVFFFLLGGLALVACQIFGDYAGGLVLQGIIIISLAIWAIRWNKGAAKADRDREQAYKECSECADIRKTLSLPTRSQMAQFIEEIRTIEDPSKQQMIYREFLEKSDANICTYPLDAERFTDMQAAWIYYSKNDSQSPERKRWFGDQDLSQKNWFDPSIDRSDEPTTGCSKERFLEFVKQIPMELKTNWCHQPTFARKVFNMIEESAPITAETLYPIMLEAYKSPASTEAKIQMDLTKTNMEIDIAVVWASLLPKALHAISKILISPAFVECKEQWLKIESFQIALLPFILEKRFLSQWDLFPILYKTYNSLVSEEFSHKPQKYDFRALWCALNDLGKKVGKGASPFEYPKYVIESTDLVPREVQEELVPVLPKLNAVFPSWPSASGKDRLLGIDLFQVACLPAIRENRHLNNEDLFPMIRDVYEQLCAANRLKDDPLLQTDIAILGKKLGEDISFLGGIYVKH